MKLRHMRSYFGVRQKHERSTTVTKEAAKTGKGPRRMDAGVIIFFTYLNKQPIQNEVLK